METQKTKNKMETKLRMSKKMKIEMNRISSNIESYQNKSFKDKEDLIKLIPDYFKKLVNDFEICSKKALIRGWDFGTLQYRTINEIKRDLTKLEEAK